MEVNFIKQIVSSTYLFHNDILFDNVVIIFCSISTINIFAKTGHGGELIATPSTRRHVWLSRVKCAFLVQRYSSFPIYTSIYFLLIIDTFDDYIAGGHLFLG